MTRNENFIHFKLASRTSLKIFFVFSLKFKSSNLTVNTASLHFKLLKFYNKVIFKDDTTIIKTVIIKLKDDSFF